MADAWYSNAELIGILTVAGLAVATVGIPIGVWAAFRASQPRMELSYIVNSNALLVKHKEVRSAVEIRVDGVELSTPRLLAVSLLNTGKHDISTAAFDQGRPLLIDVAAEIVKILEIESTPPDFKAPKVAANGTALAVGPDLFKKGQVINITMLLDGPRPALTTPEPPFVDVDVRKRDALSQVAYGGTGRFLTVILLAIINILYVKMVGKERLSNWWILPSLALEFFILAFFFQRVKQSVRFFKRWR